MDNIDPKIARLIGQVIRIEVGGAQDPGGYTHDPYDPGGATRWGVTQAVARAYGYHGAMADYPRDEAVAVYRDKYVDRPGFADVGRRSATVARELVEAGVNLGIARPSRWLQASLNRLNDQGRRYPDITVDGVIGPQTLTTGLDGFIASRPDDEALVVLTRNLNILQGAAYNRLADRHPAFERFFYGWIAKRTSVVEIPGKLGDAHIVAAA